MALSWIRARFTCDRCGEWFTVEIDPAGKTPDGWSPFDEAVDAVRGGHIEACGYKGDPGLCSVENDAHRCGPCTSKEDAAWIEAHPSYISGIRKEADAVVVTTYDDTEYRLPAHAEPEFDRPIADYLAESA